MCQTIHLSDGEWKLMTTLWDHAPQTVTQLVRALQQETGWSKHTVIKMLSRLEEKGAVTHEEGARAKLYRPAADRQEVALSETRQFLKKVYRGSLGLMVSALTDGQGLSREEVQQLRMILDRAEQEGSDD